MKVENKKREKGLLRTMSKMKSSFKMKTLDSRDDSSGH